MKDLIRFIVSAFLIWAISLITIQARHLSPQILIDATKPANIGSIFSITEKSAFPSLEDERTLNNLLADMQRYDLLAGILENNAGTRSPMTLLPVVREMEDVLGRIGQETSRIAAQVESRSKSRPLDIILLDRERLERLMNCNSKCLDKIIKISGQYKSFAELNAAVSENIQNDRQRLSILANDLEQGKTLTLERSRITWRNVLCVIGLVVYAGTALTGIPPLILAGFVGSFLLCHDAGVR